MNIEFKSLIRILLILGSIVVINLNSDFDDILLTILMLLGVIVDFIKIENSVKELFSILVFWVIYTILIKLYSWNDLRFYYDILFQTELLKMLIIGFIYFKFKKNEMQNSIISKLWIIALFLLLSEVALNSTYGFQSIYIITIIFSLTYSIIKSYKIHNSEK
jgi:hypothetical protein